MGLPSNFLATIISINEGQNFLLFLTLFIALRDKDI